MKYVVIASAIALGASSSPMAGIVNETNIQTIPKRKVAQFIACTEAGRGLYRDAKDNLYLDKPLPHCRTVAPQPPR